MPLRIRSIVGLIPLFAVEILEHRKLEKFVGFKKRTEWFMEHRRDLARHISCLEPEDRPEKHLRLLAVPSRDRLERVLAYLFDEKEFLSPYGVRSLSRWHQDNPFIIREGQEEYRVEYVPGESNTDR